MRILFILGFPNPFPGAGWTRIGFFAKDWFSKGHEVDVLGAFGYKSIQKRGVSKFGKVNIFNLIFNMNLNHPSIFVINSLMAFIVSTLFLLAKKPSIAIVSVPLGDVGLGALLACKLIGVKCVVDCRDEWEDYTISLTNSKVERFFYSAVKKLLTRVYTKIQLVTTVTSNFADSLKRWGVTNVRLVPNGADAQVFKPLTSKKKNKVFTIFYSGGIGRYYRLDVAVKALKILLTTGFKNVKLVIAGDGETQKILDLAVKLGVSDNIDYKGAVSDKAKLACLINESDVGLIPYDDNLLWKNSLPAKFFEYCACGIPVIATAHADSLLAKIINDYEIGVFSPPMDEEQLAEAIYQLYKNESFREAASKKARVLIEEKFDRNKIAEDFLSLIKKLI
ncbi:MAG: glycosyltransferase family 4 protein [Candidatus Bathyarchaeota archaeon]|nr:glycosyltransferase family 4 protein [Candidatus Bathyarchaeum tardum]